MNNLLLRNRWVHVMLLAVVALAGLMGVRSAEARPLAAASVQVAGTSFTPATVTIVAGEVVEWTKTDGLHNIVADDGSFTSGDPNIAGFVYDHTFATAGTFTYHCAVHGALGMTGTVIVTDAGGQGAVAHIYLPFVTQH